MLQRIPYLLRYFLRSIVPNHTADNLWVWHKNCEFLREPRFQNAYRRAVHASGKTRLHIEWRLHTLCWAAQHACNLPGDFVECGVFTGICSLTVCEYINFNSTGKKFFLFDTFCGIPKEQIAEEEKRLDREHQNRLFYREDVWEKAKKNFAPYPNAILVRGRVPDTLAIHPIERVCYLHLDMNIAEPEIAAIEYFWDRLVPSALVILDDYGWLTYAPQKNAMDAFAAQKGVPILTLPTGQGLILKPN
jgi:O-methyltransferase